jgi:hypothetical protein
MATDTLSGMGRPKKSEPTDPVRLPRSLVRRARRIASHLGKDPGDYLAERVTPMVDRDEAKMLAEITRERGEGE